MKTLARTGIAIAIAFSSLNPSSLNRASNKATERPAIYNLNTVDKISDGDTVRVLFNRKVERIRFACIDAPELKQPGGKESKAYLQSILPLKSIVEIEGASADRFGRKVGEIFYQEQSINMQMVAAGHAFIYPAYLYQCKDRDGYVLAEAEAKRLQKGAWAKDDIEFPWNYRKRNRRQ